MKHEKRKQNRRKMIHEKMKRIRIQMKIEERWNRRGMKQVD